MRTVLVLLGSLSLCACSASVLRRPVTTTEASAHLEQVTRSNANEFDPAVSPDAREIAYEAAASEDAAPRVEVMALRDFGAARAGRIEYSSKDTTGLEPTWMPDGSGLLFVSKTRGSARGLVQSFGRGEGAYLVDAGDPYLTAEWPAVSPDGRTISMSLVDALVFRSGWRRARAFDRALGVSDLLGTGVTVLGAGSSPAWSPDGKRIAFARTTNGHAHLFVVNADGTDSRQITEGPTDDVDPSFSPDGRFMVFCSVHTEAGFTQANLFALRPDGAGLVQLTEGDRYACRPTWARDGLVYFHVNVGDRFHIWRIAPVGLGGGDAAGPPV